MPISMGLEVAADIVDVRKVYEAVRWCFQSLHEHGISDLSSGETCCRAEFAFNCSASVSKCSILLQV